MLIVGGQRSNYLVPLIHRLGHYEQPDVEPQFGHLWQAPLRTISVPHSWHGGASVSWTHARSFAWTSTTGIEVAPDSPDFTSTEMKSFERTGIFGRSSWAAR